MGKYKIRYGLGGGFGGCGEWEPARSNTKDDAWNEAWECACEKYESYDGMHGLRNINTIMEEDECDEEYAYEQWCEERDSWLVCEVKSVEA